MKHGFATKFLNLKQDALYRFRLVASRCFPSYITRPYPSSRLHEIRQADSEQNARHSPPADEYIDLCSMWAVEFYTPAHMDDLLASLEHLGWAEDEMRNPVTWLKHRKASQYSQAWMSLGPVIPYGIPDPYITRSLKADLPSNVLYAYGDIYCFTPSLIAITFEFVFNEKHSRIFDDALRQERESFLTATPTGYRINDPGNQRISHIRRIRRDTTRLITDWFSENIPGLCSDGLLGGDFPTCEFVTLRKGQPFPTRDEYNGELQWYLHDLGLFNSYDSWESKHMSALRFHPSSTNRYTAKYHSILSINEASWEQQDSPEENRNSRESRIYDMHRRVSGLFGIWAIAVLLQGYALHLRRLRNSKFLRSTHHKSAVGALRRIAESVSDSIDIAAVTDELESLMRTKLPFGYEVEEFVPRADAPEYWWQGSLEQLLHRQIGENANWVRSMDNAIRDHLIQYGTILGMEEDVRLQRKIAGFTYAMFALTVVLVILTATTVSAHFPWVRTMWNSLGDLLQVSRFL